MNSFPVGVVGFSVSDLYNCDLNNKKGFLCRYNLKGSILTGSLVWFIGFGVEELG